MWVCLCADKKNDFDISKKFDWGDKMCEWVAWKIAKLFIGGGCT
jgi:hypothetical protein